MFLLYPPIWGIFLTENSQKKPTHTFIKGLVYEEFLFFESSEESSSFYLIKLVMTFGDIGLKKKS